MAGSTLGKTKITVSPTKALSSNKYKYKVQENDFEALPELDDDLTAWTTWDGSSDITATTDYYICVAEVDKHYQCDKVGKAKVVALDEE